NVSCCSLGTKLIMMRPQFVKQTLAVGAVLFSLHFITGCRGLGASPSDNNGGGGAPVIVSFTATPASASSGAAVSLSWQTQNATSVSITPGVGGQAANGSVTVNPTATTT